MRSIHLLVVALFLCFGAARGEDLPVKSGEKIAFLGDSITAGGMGSPMGYCKLVISGLEANGITTTPIGAGVSGHKSNQMLERLGGRISAETMRKMNAQLDRDKRRPEDVAKEFLVTR